MYAGYFGLTKKAFDMTPDPAFLFLTPQHREALAGLTYGVLDRKGFLVLSGKAGTGKTTLLAWVLAKLSTTQVKTSVILNPLLTPREFLEMAMLDFGIEDIPDSKARRLHRLQKFLLETSQAGQTAALVVDEAHKLSPELMEEIRLLGNTEQPGGKLLQIVLAGQSELDDVLNAPSLWQLKQRISIRVEIKPLDRLTIEHYINFRWTKAGGQGTSPFPPETLDALFEWSQGIPRLVNSLCDNSLTLAFADNRRIVGRSHVETAATDLRLPSPARAKSEPPVPIKPQPQQSISAIKTVATEPPSNNAPAPLRIATLERYAPPTKVSFFTRWAGRIGLA